MWAILIDAANEKPAALKDMSDLCQQINDIKEMERICDRSSSNNISLLDHPLFTLLFIMMCKENSLPHIEKSNLPLFKECKMLFEQCMKPYLGYLKMKAWESRCLPVAIEKVTGLTLEKHHLALLSSDVMGILSQLCCLQVNVTTDSCIFLDFMKVGCLLRSILP